MIKTLAAANKSERETFKIPRSVQQSIPIQRVFRDGIWQTGRNKYSRTWRFADINYSVASHEDQQEMFLAYCGVLNSLPTGATAKITINNRRLNGADFQHSVLMRLKGDELDRYRQEYNGILTEKALESNNLIQDKYITISVARKSIDEARTFFKRVDIDLSKSFGKLDSGAKPLDNHERLRIFHDFSVPARNGNFNSTCPPPCAGATTSRTPSPQTGCSSRRTTSSWAARWAASCSSGSTPATSKTA